METSGLVGVTSAARLVVVLDMDKLVVLDMDKLFVLEMIGAIGVPMMEPGCKKGKKYLEKLFNLMLPFVCLYCNTL